MVSEPQRLQYLEAMGLTAWTARYRLPHAAPTPQCEWPAQEETPSPPQARLHALLDAEPSETESSPPPAAEGHAVAASEAPPRRDAAQSPARSARALLDGGAPVTATPAVRGSASVASDPTAEQAPRPSGRETGKDTVALRFTLQVAALDGRWLLLLPQQTLPDEEEMRLLFRLLEVAGITPDATPDFLSFKWPMLENLPVGNALEEARQGLRAFIEGRRSRGWQPERVLSFGSLDAELERVLDFSGELQERHSCLLDLPCWHGPALAELSSSADHKRALWPELAQWRHWWERGVPNTTRADDA